MQYADVLVDNPYPKSSILTYSIPASLLAQIKLYQLVDVKLRNRVVRGIVVAFKKNADKNFRTIPIDKLRSKESIIDKNHLDFYRKIAHQSLSTLSDVVFYFIPPRVKEVNQKLLMTENKSKSGLVKLIFGTAKKRFDYYLNIIDKINANILIIFPDLVMLNEFLAYAKNNTTKEILTYTALDKPNIRWEKWLKIQSGKYVVVSTKSGLGLLGEDIVIIDQPDHPGFEIDQRPRININDYIKIRKYYGSKVIIGDNFPSLFSYYNYQIKLIPLQKNIRLVNQLDFDKYINDSNLKRVLFAVPQKYQYRALKCKVCATMLKCDNCQKNITQADNNRLICSNCHKTFNGYPNCSKCKSNSYDGFNFGVDNLVKIINNKLKKKLTITIDKDHIPPLSIINQEEIIAATTHRIFDLPVRQFDKVIIYGFDFLLDFPKYNQEENIFKTIMGFTNLGNKADIITKRPDHKVFQNIRHPEKLYQLILDERRPVEPPFTRIITLVYKNILADNFEERFSQLASKLIKVNPNTIILNISLKNWYNFYDLVLDDYKNIKKFSIEC